MNTISIALFLKLHLIFLDQEAPGSHQWNLLLRGNINGVDADFALSSEDKGIEKIAEPGAMFYGDVEGSCAEAVGITSVVGTKPYKKYLCTITKLALGSKVFKGESPK